MFLRLENPALTDNVQRPAASSGIRSGSTFPKPKSVTGQLQHLGWPGRPQSNLLAAAIRLPDSGQLPCSFRVSLLADSDPWARRARPPTDDHRPAPAARGWHFWEDREHL